MRRVVFLLLALSALLIAPDAARACGMPLEATIPSERALVVHADGREEIVVQLQLAASNPEAKPAVVFPVPGDAEVDALDNAEVFEYLEEVSKPRIRTVVRRPSDEDGATAAGGGAPGGVNVIGREVVGGYDVARLEAGSTSSLLRYLARNDFTLPPGAAPIVQEYIDEDWRFVAIKLAENGPSDGALSPLRIAFDSPRPVYPMRLDQLAQSGVSIDLYVATDHKVALDRLSLEYAGALSDVPASLSDVLGRASYLTKLRGVALAPQSLTEDFVFAQAADDEPFRAVQTRIVFGDPPDDGAPIGAIVTVVVLLLIAAAGAALVLSRRRRRRAAE